jgi:hypothetical protein
MCYLRPVIAKEQCPKRSLCAYCISTYVLTRLKNVRGAGGVVTHQRIIFDVIPKPDHSSTLSTCSCTSETCYLRDKSSGVESDNSKQCQCNVPGKRAVQTSEPSTPPTFRTSTCAQLNHVVECYIYISVQNYVAPIVSFLHVRELCPASLHLVQRARAWRLRPDRSPP